MKQYLSALILITMTLSACSLQKSGHITDRGTSYLQAKSIPPLKIPPGLSANAIHHYYPIPDRHYPDNAKAVELAPPGMLDNE